jgi:hypothetical protein
MIRQLPWPDPTQRAAIFPNVSYKVGAMAGSMLVGGLSNLLGQVIGSDLTSDNKKDAISLNWGALLASTLAGAFAPLWLDLSGALFGGSWLAEGILSGVSSGYFELAGQTIWNLYSDCSTNNYIH